MKSLESKALSLPKNNKTLWRINIYISRIIKVAHLFLVKRFPSASKHLVRRYFFSAPKTHSKTTCRRVAPEHKGFNGPKLWFLGRFSGQRSQRIPGYYKVSSRAAGLKSSWRNSPLQRMSLAFVSRWSEGWIRGSQNPKVKHGFCWTTRTSKMHDVNTWCMYSVWWVRILSVFPCSVYKYLYYKTFPAWLATAMSL